MKIPVIIIPSDDRPGEVQRFPILGFKELKPDLRRRAVYREMLKQSAKRTRRKAKP